jgi:TRAP-type uncharacterized transport system substrate-binding protein
MTEQELTELVNDLRFQVNALKQRVEDIVVMTGANTIGYYDLKTKLNELVKNDKETTSND